MIDRILRRFARVKSVAGCIREGAAGADASVITWKAPA